MIHVMQLASDHVAVKQNVCTRIFFKQPCDICMTQQRLLIHGLQIFFGVFSFRHFIIILVFYHPLFKLFRYLFMIYTKNKQTNKQLPDEVLFSDSQGIHDGKAVKSVTYELNSKHCKKWENSTRQATVCKHVYCAYCAFSVQTTDIPCIWLQPT